MINHSFHSHSEDDLFLSTSLDSRLGDLSTTGSGLGNLLDNTDGNTIN
jgi:hypothetical protein